jgi:hypothetical protein
MHRRGYLTSNMLRNAIAVLCSPTALAAPTASWALWVLRVAALPPPPKLFGIAALLAVCQIRIV